MKAIWSFWSAPFAARRKRDWASEKHHLLAWVLSVQLARKHYGHTELYTDDDGARLLVDALGLPFDRVSTSLNDLAVYDPMWWTLGKIHTWRQQDEPFVHIDNDVFLWKRLPWRLEQADVFTQNPEPFVPGHSYYQPERIDDVLTKQTAGWVPEEWRWYCRANGDQHGDCCGILGGRNVAFIRHYAEYAFRLMTDPANARGWDMLNDRFVLMVSAEQYMLSACVAFHRGRSASPFQDVAMRYLFETPEKAFEPDEAARVGYTHLIADAKRDPALADRLEDVVQQGYPASYERCRAYDKLLTSFDRHTM